MTRVGNALSFAIEFVCTALFLIGAFLYTASRGQDQWVQKGKDFMLGSVLGLMTVVGSYAILRTVYYFIYQVSTS